MLDRPVGMNGSTWAGPKRKGIGECEVSDDQCGEVSRALSQGR
jgi:hypothetical protein